MHHRNNTNGPRQRGETKPPTLTKKAAPAQVSQDGAEHRRLEIPDDVLSQLIRHFGDYDLTPWRAQPHRLAAEGAQVDVMAVHFPRILLFYKISEVISARVDVSELQQWRVEFGTHVFRCELGEVRFDLSKCERIGGRGWMALWETRRGE